MPASSTARGFRARRSKSSATRTSPTPKNCSRNSRHEPGHKLLITDGVFSMDGDIGPVGALADLAEKYGAIMMVDDAHACGVLGRNGRGSVDHFDAHGKVDVQVGTLSKAIGALGGYVCGTRDLIDFLYHRARPFLFSTSHPPSVAATCIAAFDILENEPERIARLWANTHYFKPQLAPPASTSAAARHRPAKHPSRLSFLATAAPPWTSPAPSSTPE